MLNLIYAIFCLPLLYGILVFSGIIPNPRVYLDATLKGVLHGFMLTLASYVVHFFVNPIYPPAFTWLGYVKYFYLSYFGALLWLPLLGLRFHYLKRMAERPAEESYLYFFTGFTVVLTLILWQYCLMPQEWFSITETFVIPFWFQNILILLHITASHQHLAVHKYKPFLELLAFTVILAMLFTLSLGMAWLLAVLTFLFTGVVIYHLVVLQESR